VYLRDLTALDRLPAAEQAEWLAFDYALNGTIPPPPIDPDAPLPEFATAQERFEYVMARV